LLEFEDPERYGWFPNKAYPSGSGGTKCGDGGGLML